MSVDLSLKRILKDLSDFFDYVFNMLRPTEVMLKDYSEVFVFLCYGKRTIPEGDLG